MKHILFALTLLLASLASTTAYAATNDKNNAQKVEARSASMAQILGLNAANTQRFTNLYAKYNAEVRAAQQQYAKIKPKKNQDAQLVPLTEEQIKVNLENQFGLSQSILNLRKKYYREYIKFMTPSQIERLYELEKKDAEHLHKLAGKNAAPAHKSGNAKKPETKKNDAKKKDNKKADAKKHDTKKKADNKKKDNKKKPDAKKKDTKKKKK